MLDRIAFLRVTCVLAAVLLWSVPHASAAETFSTQGEIKTTQVVLELIAKDPIRVKSIMRQDPPTLVLSFPGQTVLSSLPERSSIQHGVISEIQTRYRGRVKRDGSRAIDQLRIVLTGAYDYRIRTEAGQVIVEIDHPIGIAGENLAIGLGGGIIVSSLGQARVSDRFRAMQKAMEQAGFVEWTFEPAGQQPTPVASVAAAPVAAVALLPEAALAHGEVAQSQVPLSQPKQDPFTTLTWMVVLIGSAALLGLERIRRKQSETKRLAMKQQAISLSPAGTMLIEQLVWQAFERNGYRLVRSVDLPKPKVTLRVISKDGAESGLLCLINGPFFEKNTVELVVQALRSQSLNQGFLAATGSFTVPAQRKAKESRLTLIGREELVALLGSGATTEYFSKQLKSLHAQLDAARETIKQYAKEFESLRRQRNEASWGLGEERAKRSKLETQTTEFFKQVHHVDLKNGWSKQELDGLRKRWEENQWYLGEARARIKYLDEQLTQLQEIAQTVETVRRGRDEAKWKLGEEQMHREQLTAQLQALTTEIKHSVTRERGLQDQLERLKKDLDIVQEHGERRRAQRVDVGEAKVELRTMRNRLLASGSLKDLSISGLGMVSEKPWNTKSPVRISLRLPGRKRAIASRGRLIWQRKGDETQYLSGCRFVGLSATHRKLIAQSIQQQASIAAKS